MVSIGGTGGEVKRQPGYVGCAIIGSTGRGDYAG
jgi:hypothetical protein